MKSEKTVGAIVISVVALVIVSVIIFASVMNNNGVVTAGGNLMEGFNIKRSTAGALNDDFKEKYFNFCAELLDAAADTRGNVAFAPSNVMNATAFLAGAADNTTQDELENILGIKAETAAKSLGSLENRIAFKDGSGLQSSTTAWLNGSTSFGIRKSFLKENAKLYGLGIQREDFSLAEIEDLANAPLLDVTDGKTFSYMQFQPSEFMNIISGSSFSAEWEVPASSEQLFLNLFAGSLSEVECYFFRSVEDKFIEGSSYIGAIKPLKGNYSFVGLVPKSEEGLYFYSVADVVRELKAGSLKTLIEKAKSKKVAVTLPQYTNSVNSPTTVNFTEKLESLGAASALKVGADFTDMAPNSYNLHLNNLVASGEISLSTSGSCPSGSDGKKVSEKALEECDAAVRFDSSFVYFIYDNESELPVYCGILNNLQ